jgi:hypothetical protein
MSLSYDVSPTQPISQRPPAPPVSIGCAIAYHGRVCEGVTGMIPVNRCVGRPRESNSNVGRSRPATVTAEPLVYEMESLYINVQLACLGSAMQPALFASTGLCHTAPSRLKACSPWFTTYHA